MTVVLLSLGALLVFSALVDVAWTTVAAGSGAGPLSGRLAARCGEEPWPCTVGVLPVRSSLQRGSQSSSRSS